MSIFIEHKGDWWRWSDKETRQPNGPEINGSQLFFTTTTPQKKREPAKKARKA